MSRRLPPRLLALTPGDLGAAHIERFLNAAARAITSGLAGILVREPQMGDKETLALASALRARLGDSGFLALHDRVHLAEETRADAVQLGFRSLRPRDARALLPDSIAIGFSAHADDEIDARAASDYLLLGPVFDTASKRGVKSPLGVDGLRAGLARDPRPTWAIGGITAENAGSVLATGARGIAVRGAIFGVADPAGAVLGILRSQDAAR